MNQLQNILITGTSSGFGFLTARTLLNHGYTVFASMRGLESKNAEAAERLKRTAAETDGRLHLLDLDVTDSASVQRAVRQAQDAAGEIHVAVNNAGFGVGGLAETVTIEQFRQQFEINLFGVQRVMQAVLPGMRRRGQGLIINTSSIMGRVVIPFAAAYTASKYALEGLSESYRYELSGTGVDVVIIEPGAFGTSFMANMTQGADTDRLTTYGSLAELPDKLWSGFGSRLSGQDAPNPQDIADAVLRLIQTPAGKRPLRTVVDPLSGGQAPRTVNQTTDQIQAQLFENMQLKELLSVKE